MQLTPSFWAAAKTSSRSRMVASSSSGTTQGGSALASCSPPPQPARAEATRTGPSADRRRMAIRYRAMEATLVAVVVIALFFDFTNGFHDTANSIATSVSTRALSPRMAVLSSSVLNFAGAFVSLEVAATVAKGIVEPDVITLEVVLAGLVGAISWNLFTWYLGLPSSSSHALIGGIVGSATAAAGFDVIQWDGLKDKVLIPSLAAPVFGVVGSAALMLAIVWIVRRRSPSRVNRVFRRLQLVSGAFVAFTHGTNDA